MEISSPDTSKRSGTNEDISECSTKKAKPAEEGKESEESHMLELLTITLDTIIVLKKVPEDKIRSAIQKIINSFKEFKFYKINLSKWDFSCAYLFRYGLHGSGLTRCRALEALEKCKDLAQKFKESDLNIISLGGGSGNNVIGLCSALYEIEVQSRLNITIVDSVREWSSYLNLVKLFIKEGDYGNVSKLFHRNDVNLSFLQVQFPGDLEKNKEYFGALREADVILMTKFLSGFKWKSRPDIVESVHENMKEGAFVLFIDSPFCDEVWSDFELLYLSESGEDHRYTMSVTAKRFEFSTCFSSEALVAVLRKK